jgi:hypothetical protein
MSVSNGPRDTQPLSWLGRVPIYATTMLVAASVAMAVLIIMLLTARVDPAFLMFNPVDFWTQAKLWQFFTHPFYNFINSLWFLAGVLCLYWAGVEVEKFVGRKVWAKLLLVICAAPVVASTLWWMAGSVIPVGGIDLMWVGLFLCFATIYPNLELCCRIPAKWFAFTVVGIDSLLFLPNHAWGALSIFLFLCASVHFYTRYELGHWTLPDFVLPSISLKKSPKFHVVPKAENYEDGMRSELEPELDQEVNAILDKIAKSGIGSLTAEERGTLQRAREELMKKEGH